MPSPQRLSPLDRVFLDLDTRKTPQQVGWIIQFEGEPPSIDELRAHIGSRLDRLPLFRCRVTRPWRRLGNPVWITDPDFAIERHVSRQPAAGEDLATLAGKLLSERLARDRPLWRMWLIEGLSEGWAIAGHGHHALIDGIAASQVAQLLLDATDGSEPAAARGSGRRPRRSPRTLLSAARMMAVRGPATPIDGPPDPARVVGLARFDLRTARTAARAHGATTNDAFMAASAIAIGELLRGRGAQPPKIKALMPFRLRTDSRGRAAGNAIATVTVELPLDERDSAALLRTVAARTRAGKRLGNAGAMAVLARGAGLIPAPLRPAITRFVYRLLRFNVIVSNIPGPPVEVQLLGRRATAFYPFVPITQGQGLSIGAMSYAGTLFVGVSGSARAVPEAVAVADCIERALAEISAD